jgi:hypothetical protein
MHGPISANLPSRPANPVGCDARAFHIKTAQGPLGVKALNRLRDSQRPHRLSGNIIPRGEMVSSGPAALS